MQYNSTTSTQSEQVWKAPQTGVVEKKAVYQVARKPRLTAKQKIYADYLLNNPKATLTEATLQAYDVKDGNMSTAGMIGSDNLKKPSIQLYLDNHGYKAMTDMVQIAGYARDYGKQGGKDGASYAQVAVQANKDIMDRAYGKATTRIEVSSKSVSVNIDLTGTLPVDESTI